MKEKQREVDAVINAAIKAWHRAAQKHHAALQTVVEMKQEMLDLERIIDGGAPPVKRGRPVPA